MSIYRFISNVNGLQNCKNNLAFRDVLKDLVPSISQIDKVSTLTVLSEARKYCNHINAQVGTTYH